MVVLGGVAVVNMPLTWLFFNGWGPIPALGFAGYKSPVDGLFVSGAGTHPSAGICGVPGKQAARSVLRTLRSRWSK